MRSMTDLHTPHPIEGKLAVSPPVAVNSKDPLSEVTDTARRYVRKNAIGKGATKVVYRAFDEEEGIEVAWNEIDAAGIADLGKVQREVELLQRLHHPNIIACHTSWYDSARGCLIFITELMTSGTLTDFIAQQTSAVVKTHVMVKYCRQILCGLAYLHQNGVIHRDLKCNNVFVNGHKGEVKIGDLGLSIASRAANSVIGTPEYMAPEIYEEHYTNAVDMWSFGMCMMQMVSGQRPYEECENVGQIFRKVTNGILPVAKDNVTDPLVREVVLQCLSLDPAKRPSAAVMLTHSLFKVEEQADSDNGISVAPTTDDQTEGHQMPSGTKSEEPFDQHRSSSQSSHPANNGHAHELNPPDLIEEIFQPVSTGISPKARVMCFSVATQTASLYVDPLSLSTTSNASNVATEESTAGCEEDAKRSLLIWLDHAPSRFRLQLIAFAMQQQWIPQEVMESPTPASCHHKGLTPPAGSLLSCVEGESSPGSNQGNHSFGGLLQSQPHSSSDRVAGGGHGSSTLAPRRPSLDEFAHSVQESTIYSGYSNVSTPNHAHALAHAQGVSHGFAHAIHAPDSKDEKKKRALESEQRLRAEISRLTPSSSSSNIQMLRPPRAPASGGETSSRLHHPIPAASVLVVPDVPMVPSPVGDPPPDGAAADAK